MHVAPIHGRAIRVGEYATHPIRGRLQLSEELTSTENKVAFARQAYNDSVMGYNNQREMFPGSVIAGMFSFQPAQLLELDEPGARQAPKVSFS